MTAPNDQQSLRDEIADLERRLQDAKSRLNANEATVASSPSASDAALHALLLLADSALPLGSFAFSSGLESYLAHHKPSPPSASQLPSFNVFLRLSLSTLASTALPYVLAGYRSPADIETLDNDFDASTPCTVARRASIAQGRALLTVWERSYKAQYDQMAASGTNNRFSPIGGASAVESLTSFSAALRRSDLLNAHLAPLWGLVTRVLDIPLRDSAYLFLFSHARTVVSAAVRASVMGPYQAQAVLASAELQDRIRGLVGEGWDRSVEDAGQSVPVMDLWVGRHEKFFVLLLLAALAASSDPAQVPLEIPTTKFPWIQRLASIGDSYSAGLGAGERIDFYCSRYAKSYPNILHTSLLGKNDNRTHQFLACSGQTSTEILDTQVPALSTDLDLLTISAGGNDIGLSPILSNCVYQFYMASEDDCQTSIAEAQARIASKSQLYKNITNLIDAAKPKMNPDHGVIYLTGYAAFFGIDDATCDNVTWAVWSTLERSKQYLKLELRQALNDMVRAVNDVLRSVVDDAGPTVRFIDYNAHIEALRGRYCEAGVSEPAPNRLGLAFYEWDTVDKGENATELRNRTGGDVPRGSFEGDIAERINKTLEEHPGWEFDPEKGFVNKTKGREMGEKGAIENTIHWLLPDSWKRVFHLRPEGHGVVARLVVEDLERNKWGEMMEL
ncbi:hypothetical protein N0V90_002010 [Kalmusia sp. IMI 367209]|nr:hypothetical protein N0V90_002010 [Kalmusia sp. IMI 367209]